MQSGDSYCSRMRLWTEDAMIPEITMHILVSIKRQLKSNKGGVYPIIG